jgi:glutamine---fructose-6-phosphate transaminase (isomerizing)
MIRGMPGDLMRAEMDEQPAVLARLLARRGEVANALAGPAPAGILIVARGSSDHAAIYGRYLLELATGRPAALAAPSLHTRYRARTDVTGWLVIGVSQSGETPEVVDVVRRLREGGGRAVAVTNGAGSPLAEAADVVVALDAGEERAVPATKTYTAQLGAFALLAAALGAPPWDDLAGVADAVAATLADPAPVTALVEAWAEADGLLVAARGFLFPAALEAALKVRETALVPAQGFSTADLLHGPIAAVEPGAPALLLRAEGPTAEDVDAARDALRERGADVRALPLPGDLPEALLPFPAAVRAQQLALGLALRRGLDPDAPAGLRKVTPTR